MLVSCASSPEATTATTRQTTVTTPGGVHPARRRQVPRAGNGNAGLLIGRSQRRHSRNTVAFYERAIRGVFVECGRAPPPLSIGWLYDSSADASAVCASF